jgi:Skp family chaperone for outer membrane proteins
MNKHERSNGLFRGLIAVAAIGIVALAITSLGQLRAQNQSGSDGNASKVAQVGTYDRQKAFRQYPGRKDLMDAFTSARSQMSKAQQEGNQKKIKEIQQNLQKKQTEIVKKFQKDVKKALPDVADKAKVKVVAVDVVYTADDVNTKDITSDIVKAIGGDPEKMNQLPQGLGQ